MKIRVFVLLVAAAASSVTSAQTFPKGGGGFGRGGDTAAATRGSDTTAAADPAAAEGEPPAADVPVAESPGGESPEAASRDADPPSGDTGELAATSETEKSTVTDEQLTTLQEQVSTVELAAETKAELGRLVAEAKRSLTDAAQAVAAAADFENRTQALPANRAKVEASLERLKAATLPPVDTSLGVDELEQLVAAAKTDLDKARSRATDAAGLAAGNTADLAAARRTLAGVPEERAELEALLKRVRGADGLEAAVQTAYATARLRAVDAVEARAQAERTFRELVARGDSYAKHLSVAELERDLAQKRFDALSKRVASLRAEAAARQVREARAKAAMAVPELKDLAQRNSETAERLAAATRDSSRLDEQRDASQALISQWKQKEEAIRSKASVADRSSATELVRLRLQELRTRLPDVSERRAAAGERVEKQRQATWVQMRGENELEELGTPQEEAARMVAAGVIPEELRSEAEAMLTTRIELLQKLDGVMKTYTDSLDAFDTAERTLVTQIDNFADYIDGQMLWSASHPTMLDTGNWADWSPSARMKWLLKPQSWVRTLERVVADFRGHRSLYVTACLGLIALFYVRQRLRVRSRELARQAASKSNTSVGPTLRVMLMTLADAATWPAVLAFAAYRLGAVFSMAPSFEHITDGLLRVAVAFFSLEVLHNACRAGGLAELVGVSPAVARHVRKKVNRLEIVGLPLSTGIVLLHSDTAEPHLQPVERLLFVAACGVLLLFCRQMLKSDAPPVKEAAADNPDGWFTRLRPLIYVLVAAVPVSLAALSVVGYHVTAIRLIVKVEATVWLAIGVVAVQMLLASSVRLHRRRLKIEALRKGHSAQTPAGRTEEAAAAVGDMRPVVAAQAHAEDLGRLSEQTDRLIRTLAWLAFGAGCYLIWRDVLPALSRVTDYAPYTVSGIEPGEIVDITVGAILAAIAAAAVAVTATRNLPGLLEFSVLQRLGVDKSVRYAATTIMTYVLAMVGILVVGNLIGLSWRNLQWLAAGLSVGLGFGLQEIFANFISGLLILIEQPVRVGDIVTIDDITGVVSKVRIRATTITNWDRKEYIVPNKEFITGRLLNWTLSDSTNRLVMHVGVAYGTDTDRACNVIHEVLAAHPEVKDDPPPMVTFEEFGDSSLNLVVRCFLPTLDNRLATQHQVLTQIHERFQAEGIEIPFPQRDLNVRHLPALGVNPESTMPEMRAAG